MIKSKNSAKAIIIENNHVLLLKKISKDGRVFYTLPGGTQDAGETLEAALIREVKEETNANVTSYGLANVYEHSRPSKKDPKNIKHKIEFAFVCRLIGTYTPQNGPNPDPNQAVVEWVPLSQLNQLSLDPHKLRFILAQIQLPTYSVYLGDVTEH